METAMTGCKYLGGILEGEAQVGLVYGTWARGFSRSFVWTHGGIHFGEADFLGLSDARND